MIAIAAICSRVRIEFVGELFPFGMVGAVPELTSRPLKAAVWTKCGEKATGRCVDIDSTLCLTYSRLLPIGTAFANRPGCGSLSRLPKLRQTGGPDRPKDGLGTAMARRCELTGKGVLTGNNVSHANNRTRRRFLPNLVNVSLLSDTLGQKVRMRISAAALRSVEHRGGLDAYLVSAKDGDLSPKLKQVRKTILAKQAEAAEAAA